MRGRSRRFKTFVALGIIAVVLVVTPLRWVVVHAYQLFFDPEVLYYQTGIVAPWHATCDVTYCVNGKPYEPGMTLAPSTPAPGGATPVPTEPVSTPPATTQGPGGTLAPAPTTLPLPTSVAPSPTFVTWTSSGGYITADVPAGWEVTGGLGDDLSQGMFRITATSPDGSMLVTFAHNWFSYPERQYGTYAPGSSTITSFILGNYVKSVGGGLWRVTYRTANSRVLLTSSPVAIPLDTGMLGYLYQASDGTAHMGTAAAQTLNAVPSINKTGLWRLRLFAATDAPADAQSQAEAQAAVERMANSLSLSGDFFKLWTEGFAQTQKVMAAYGDDILRIWTSAYTANNQASDAIYENWSEYMRGGSYLQDSSTGTQVWVSGFEPYNWINGQGQIVSNSTGTPPANGSTWNPLAPVK